MAKRRSHHALRAARLRWLLAHPESWSTAFEMDGACWGLSQEKKRAIVDAWKKAGLIAPTTYWADVRVEAMVLRALAHPRKAARG